MLRERSGDIATFVEHPAYCIFKEQTQQTFTDLPRCLENVLKTFCQDALKISWRRFEDILQDLLKTSWKTKNCYAEDILKTSWRHILKMSWGHVLLRQYFNIGSTLFQLCGSKLKQRWSDVEYGTKSNVGFSSLHNVDTTLEQRCTALKQCWKNIDTTLYQVCFNVTSTLKLYRNQLGYWLLICK